MKIKYNEFGKRANHHTLLSDIIDDIIFDKIKYKLNVLKYAVLDLDGYKK
jgi:hypothetical protein